MLHYSWLLSHFYQRTFDRMESNDSITRTFSDFKCGNPRLLYKFLYRDLLLYASSLLPGNLSLLAEDCVQDSIEKAFHQRDLFTSHSHLKSFLYKCIHSQAISILRTGVASQNYCSHSFDSEANEEDFLVSYIRSETLARLYNAIDLLPDDLRELLQLSFEEGLKNKEIADRLGVAEITVKKKKARTLSLLKQSLGSSDRYLLMLLLIGDRLNSL